MGAGNPENNQEEWTKVTYKKKANTNKNVREEKTYLIFLHNIPDEATGREIWKFFSSCGSFIDIILLKKRDKNGKRIGFIHTSSERDAGAIISNAKMSKGLSRKISMSINNPKRKSSYRQNFQTYDKPKNPLSGEERVKKAPEEEIPFEKRMFEFTEVEIDEEVEQALLSSKLGYSWFEEDVQNIKDKFCAMGLGKYKVIALSKRKFIISKDEKESWEDLDRSDLSVWFNKIRNFEEFDHVMSRVVWIECKGLPMPLWKEKNLRAFTDRLGKWGSWSYQSDSLDRFFNPQICIDTSNLHKVEEEMTILYEGNQMRINFTEILDEKDLEGKMSPMEFSEDKANKDNSVNGSVSDGKENAEVSSKSPPPKKLCLELKDHSTNNGENRQSTSSKRFKALGKASPKLVTHEKVRKNSSSSDVLSVGSFKPEDWQQSEFYVTNVNNSSQSTLCSGVVRKFRVKSRRG